MMQSMRIQAQAGLEIKKGKRGPRPNVEQMEHVLTLHPSKSYRELAKEELQAEPEGEAKNLLIEKERERIRAVKRRESAVRAKRNCLPGYTIQLCNRGIYLTPPDTTGCGLIKAATGRGQPARLAEPIDKTVCREIWICGD